MEQNKSGVGSIIGIVIIISIIILGGLYFWGKRIEESKMKEAMVNSGAQQTVVEQNEAAAINGVSSSDDLGSIEADLQSSNFDDMNAELNAKK